MTTWIFQGNPRRFDVDGYLSRERVITWLVSPQDLQRIQVGDTALIWRADGDEKGSGGVVALGTITQGPEVAASPDAAELWKDDAPEGSHHRVTIEVEEYRPTVADGMIARTELEAHEELQNLRILRFRPGISYEVAEEHERMLLEMWRNGSSG